MRKSLFALVLCLVMTAAVAASFAQTAGPVAGTSPAAPPAPTMMRPQSPMMARMASMPAPCIVPTLRLLQSRSVDSLAIDLKMTADQKAKVLDLLTKAETAMLPTVETQRKAAAEYVDILVKPDAKEADLSAAADKAMKAELAVLNEKIKTFFALKALLTPEQSKLFADKLGEYSSLWHPQPLHPLPAVVPGGPKPIDSGKK